MHVTTRGLVLREVQYKESDKLLTVLTEEGGKRTVKAQGCRRKGSALGASSQLLVWSDLVLVEYRDRFSLKEASTLEEFRGLRNDLDKLALGSYFAEVTETVAQEGVPQPELLSLLLNSLYALDRLNKPLPLVKTAFELRLLREAGYEPMADQCAVCGEERPQEPRLDLSEGLLRCAHCRMEEGSGISMPLTPAGLDALRAVLQAHPKRFLSFSLEGESLQKLGELTEAYLMTQLERGFRTLDFYKQLTYHGLSAQRGDPHDRSI